jgi:hypothetical protein
MTAEANNVRSPAAKIGRVKLALLCLCGLASVYGLADGSFVAGRASSSQEYSFSMSLFLLLGGCSLLIAVGSMLVLRGRSVLGASLIVLAGIIETFFWLGMHG